jgi:hypothetical protein
VPSFVGFCADIMNRIKHSLQCVCANRVWAARSPSAWSDLKRQVRQTANAWSQALPKTMKRHVAVFTVFSEQIMPAGAAC